MAQHDLYIDIDRGLAVLGPDNSDPAALPPFVQGDTLNLRIWLLDDFNRQAPYTKVPVSGLTVQAALGVKSGSVTTYYTQQFTWTPSVDLGQPYFEALFPMNTAEISTLLGSAQKAEAFFEVKMISDALPVTVLSKQVTVHAAVIKEGGLTVPAGQTPLSVEVANAMYLGHTIVGYFDVINPVTGLGFRISADETGAFKADPIPT